MALPSFLTASAWKVVARPVVRLGGALLLGGALAASVAPSSQPAPQSVSGYRLVLEADSSNPSCYYGSAWNDGDVMLSHDASDGRTVTLTSRYDFEDGCTWEAKEVLTPSSGDGYTYEYTERVVSCPEGAKPDLACRRHGVVAVVPAE